MSEDNTFHDLITRVRAGDQEAAAELVRSYEPTIRRVVKVHLRDARLRRQVDSLDICQSVLGTFFVRAALGQFDLTCPEQLLGLLVAMARNKLATQARKPAVQRRSLEAAESDSEVPDANASPSDQVAGRDLLEAVRQRLKPDELYLAEQRAAGRPWQEIAQERGASAEALRKQLTRALNRVGAELGLEELSDD